MQRPALSPERIIEAAAQVADEGGLTAVSMRSVGRQLDVEAMSLYHHVPSKQALLDRLADWVVTQVDLPEIGTPWRRALTGLCDSARAVYSRHPWAISLIDSRATPGHALLRHHDQVLGCLLADGFSMALAAHAYSAVDSYVFGFVLTELQLPFRPGDAESFTEELALPTEDYPHMARLLTELVVGQNYDFGNEFSYGLGLILDQLEVRLADDQAGA
ncbi:TetR/AcrR family transcriptional regulator [Ornithinimicrobium faecis]|uniref:TetR/AcrR family transcriptional regulator n=1 Tax=Ornithinimicrobium faecis TaxID=2934158 RepID=A0ABY4YUD4_9MICO|nr:TetR/AcrR family transcriptional regulator [Ornithinimicrobium sp. HY1793]USQ80365.1 TetR/AcrR family transcriptional regulator [Ornithinimicrobium sp. HY1793]